MYLSAYCKAFFSLVKSCEFRNQHPAIKYVKAILAPLRSIVPQSFQLFTLLEDIKTKKIFCERKGAVEKAWGLQMSLKSHFFQRSSTALCGLKLERILLFHCSRSSMGSIILLTRGVIVNYFYRVKLSQ
jgi:hypothetical protein